MPQPAIFLTAEWRQLVMLNYAVDPAWLLPFVPRGTELDEFDGRAYVSVVGFRFLNTRVRGFSIPLHRDFDEVNLRFYVRRQTADELRRGVVFIREIVPRFAIAAVARVVYNENYASRPMWHACSEARYEYGWRDAGLKNRLWAEFNGAGKGAAEGSLEQFITEHYWGYAVQRDGGTVEYQVEHPSWRVWVSSAAGFEGDASTLYGPRFAERIAAKPDSALVADGSPIAVRAGIRIA